MKKYELTASTKIVLGKTLYQIKALASFGDVEAGELGGYVENEENLSQDGNAWVYGNARVSGNARIAGNACVSGNMDYMTVDPAELRGDTTTFYRRNDGVTMVVCGRFHDTIDAFEKHTNEADGNSKRGEAYRAEIALARAKINTEPAHD